MIFKLCKRFFTVLYPSERAYFHAFTPSKNYARARIVSKTPLLTNFKMLFQRYFSGFFRFFEAISSYYIALLSLVDRIRY